MIRRIKSSLSIKVFFLTSMLMAACCALTYSCIVRFAPYVYSHDMSAGEELVLQLAQILDKCPLEEAPYFIAEESEILASYVEDEYIFRMFTNSGEEIALPNMDSTTGMRIEDFKAEHISTQYPVAFIGQEDKYTLIVSKNTNKESQVVEALHKSLPILCIIVIVVSVIAALFYTWYMTRPIKQVSRISRRMATMDFSGLCPTGRTDEVGVLSQSLNELSGRLSSALSELQSANRKLQEDIDMERELERQRVKFFFSCFTLN